MNRKRGLPSDAANGWQSRLLTFHEIPPSTSSHALSRQASLILFSLEFNPNVKTSVTELPFNSFLGIQMSTDSSQLLRLPSGEKYLNHLGTVHASAQLALAEASSGEFLLRHFGSTHGILPVVRRLEAKFRKPANGAVTSMASAAPESLAHLDDELASKGRSFIPITVELHDESGAHTLSATIEWFIQRLSTDDKNT